MTKRFLGPGGGLTSVLSFCIVLLLVAVAAIPANAVTPTNNQSILNVANSPSPGVDMPLIAADLTACMAMEEYSTMTTSTIADITTTSAITSIGQIANTGTSLAGAVLDATTEIRLTATLIKAEAGHFATAAIDATADLVVSAYDNGIIAAHDVPMLC